MSSSALRRAASRSFCNLFSDLRRFVSLFSPSCFLRGFVSAVESVTVRHGFWPQSVSPAACLSATAAWLSSLMDPCALSDICNSCHRLATCKALNGSKDACFCNHGYTGDGTTFCNGERRRAQAGRAWCGARGERGEGCQGLELERPCFKLNFNNNWINNIRLLPYVANVINSQGT